MPDWLFDTLKFLLMVSGSGLAAWTGFHQYTKRMATLTADTIIQAVDQTTRITEIERRVGSIERDHAENTERIIKSLDGVTERIDKLFGLVAARS